MKRRTLLKTISALATTTLAASASVWAHTIDIGKKIIKLDKNVKEWKALITDDQYYILFEEGTEAPGSSPLNDVKDKGTFICAACYLPLFKSETKYDSGTGWPSFYQAIDGRVGTKLDLKLIWPRTEYHCIRCGGHQGHVFEDGPQPTGLRYCNNGLALKFIPESKPLPKLRS